MGHFSTSLRPPIPWIPFTECFYPLQNKTSVALQKLICGPHCFPCQIQTRSAAGQANFRMYNLCSPIGLPQKGPCTWFNVPIGKFLIVFSLNISFRSESHLDNGAVHLQKRCTWSSARIQDKAQWPNAVSSPSQQWCSLLMYFPAVPNNMRFT